MRTKYNSIKFFDEWLSAAEIARRHGLSVPTILKRHARGLTGRDLVAPVGSLPRAARGEGDHPRSLRPTTELQALWRLRRAKESQALAVSQLDHARASGDSRATVARLEKQVRRAEVRRMYWSAMAEIAAKRDKEAEEEKAA